MKPRSITTWLKKSKSRRFFFKKLAAFLFGEVIEIPNESEHSDDELMQQTIDSIRQIGILSPVIIRPSDNGFEMVSGHRRLHAAQLAGLAEIPAVIRVMTDGEAVIFMVDSNLQRESILPSEKAKTYQRHIAI